MVNLIQIIATEEDVRDVVGESIALTNEWRGVAPRNGLAGGACVEVCE
jgi:hypothetical protein